MRGKVEIGINEDKLLLCLQTSSMCNIIMNYLKSNGIYLLDLR